MKSQYYSDCTHRQSVVLAQH